MVAQTLFSDVALADADRTVIPVGSHVPVTPPVPRGSVLTSLSLAGVPKPALTAVFGKELSRRIWTSRRRLSGKKEAHTEAGPAQVSDQTANQPPVSNDEIAAALLAHLCRQAATTLRQQGQVARRVAVRVVLADGRLEYREAELGHTAEDNAKMETTAKELMTQLLDSTVPIAAVELKLATSRTPLGVPPRLL